jgi:hypothetical protein
MCIARYYPAGPTRARRAYPPRFGLSSRAKRQPLNNCGQSQSISPAINAAAAGTGITTDQRGVMRDAAPDIGAYEYKKTFGRRW